MNYSRLLAILSLIIGVSLFRFLPHPPNFTPVLAVALFAGAQFTDKRLAMLVPLLAMFIADIFLGLHATVPFVYGAIAIVTLLGMGLQRRRNITRTTATAVAGSLIFFIVSNFGAWLTMPELYSRTTAGLFSAYIAAIPFYQNELAGTLLFSALLFGVFYGLERSFPRLVEPAAG